MSTARISLSTLCVLLRIRCACGVNTILRPARTSRGSPVTCRKRVNVPLIAEVLRPKDVYKRQAYDRVTALAARG